MEWFPDNWEHHDSTEDPRKDKLLRSMMNRFVDRIFYASAQIFPRKPKVVDHQEVFVPVNLQKTVDDVIIHLKNVKDHLKSKGDEELSTFVDGALEAMIKNVKRIERLMEVKGSLTKQAEVFKKYNEWMDKAQPWIQLSSQAYDKAELINTIVQHTLNESNDLIDRDLKVVEDYKEHILEHLVIHQDDKTKLSGKMKETLEPYIEGLSLLKKYPETLEIDEISTWKKVVDLQRQDYFDKALRAIDDVISGIATSAPSPEEHDHLIDILSQITYMEEEIPSIIQEIARNHENSLQKEIIESRLASFEEEVHKLNLDLRLTPELVQRLENIMDAIAAAHQMFKEDNSER